MFQHITAELSGLNSAQGFDLGHLAQLSCDQTASRSGREKRPTSGCRAKIWKSLKFVLRVVRRKDSVSFDHSKQSPHATVGAFALEVDDPTVAWGL